MEVLSLPLVLWILNKQTLIYRSCLYLSLYRLIINNRSGIRRMDLHPTWCSTSGGFFHFRRAVFFSNLQSKRGNLLTKDVTFRINLNLDGESIESKSHTHPSHSETSRLLTSSLSLGVPVPRLTQCMRDE
jgi:hypothetical protein